MLSGYYRFHFIIFLVASENAVTVSMGMSYAVAGLKPNLKIRSRSPRTESRSAKIIDNPEYSRNKEKGFINTKKCNKNLYQLGPLKYK